MRRSTVLPVSMETGSFVFWRVLRHAKILGKARIFAPKVQSWLAQGK
jgi:hypothetical protein